jgi:sec-independent protein translocase protein TatB
MLDVGFSEILLTSAIALIVLGPERLPKVARQVGNWMGRARAMARQLSEQLEREVSADELLKIQSKPALPPDPPYNAPKPPPNALMASGAAATDAAALAPGAATQYEATPQTTATAPGVATPVAEQMVPATAPEPVYGLDASLTTPAAMHASDPPPTDPAPTGPHVATIDTKPLHE